MRQLILRRERALAGFALRYYVLIDRDKATFVQEMDRDPDSLRPEPTGDVSLRNGETCCLPIDEEEHHLFVAVYLESRVVTTEELVLPAGTEDGDFTVRTEYDGYRRLAFVLEKTE